MPATLKQVAARAGCAISTASNVLNGKQRLFPIGQDAKSRIMAAAEELGYQPNRIAKSLRRRKSETVGVVFAGHLELIRDPLLAEVLGGVGAGLEARGYEMLLHNGYEDIGKRIIEAANSGGVDGLLYFVYTSTYDLLHEELGKELAPLAIPVMGMQLFERHGPTPSVGVDARRIGELAVEHLHGLGHQAIGFISSSPSRWLGSRETCAGFTAAIERLGITRSQQYHFEEIEDMIRSQHHAGDRYRIGRAFAERVLARGELLPAYFIASDVTAAGFRDGLAEHGLEVPRDVALIGLGNELNEVRGSSFFTSIDNQRFQVGKRAAERLLATIDGSLDPDAESFVALQPRLIIRQSCGAHAASKGQA